MSFGIGIGDVLAILRVFDCVAVEVRNYRDTPLHFTHSGAELMPPPKEDLSATATDRAEQRG